jgi:hypothetical protein
MNTHTHTHIATVLPNPETRHSDSVWRQNMVGTGKGTRSRERFHGTLQSALIVFWCVDGPSKQLRKQWLRNLEWREDLVWLEMLPLAVVPLAGGGRCCPRVDSSGSLIPSGEAWSENCMRTVCLSPPQSRTRQAVEWVVPTCQNINNTNIWTSRECGALWCGSIHHSQNFPERRLAIFFKFKENVEPP